MAAGYVYVLANSSMPGLVKIGKTSRVPFDRAQELSGVTGIATPFIVVYEEYFEDCDAVESYVHAKLAQNGMRVSQSCEFFRAPVSEVVKTILSAGVAMSGNGSAGSNSRALPAPHNSESDGFHLDRYASTQAWDTLMEEADKHFFGLGEYFQDYTEALKLYRDAAHLGCPTAYERLGAMYQLGRGVGKDAQQALECYKQGARKGNYFCYAEMTRLFLLDGQVENARKAFSKFTTDGEADRWRSFMDFPGRHLRLILAILLLVTQPPGDSLPSYLSEFLPFVRAYIPLLLEEAKRKSSGEKAQAYSRRTKRKLDQLIYVLRASL